MQEFFITKGSTLPLLRMELVNDGRRDFRKFYEAIQDAKVTFSMTNKSTGIKRIANAEAFVIPRDKDVSGCKDEYLIEYRWKERDTREPGQYIGVFRIHFNGNVMQDGKVYPTGDLIVPIEEELQITIIDGTIKKS